MLRRWLFLVLLVANFLLFLWGYQRNPEPGADGADLGRPEGVSSIVLLSETVDSEKARRPAGDEALAEQGQIGDGASAPVSAESGAAVESARKEFASPRTCIRVGPLRQRNEAIRVSSELSAEGLDASVAVEAQQRQNGYWVLLEVEPARKAEMLDRLRAAGVQDYWYFSQGDLAHTISLGLYSDRERAESKARELIADGFDSRVDERMTEDLTYWVELRYPPQRTDLNAILESVYEAIPGLDFPPAHCPDIVTP